MTLRLRDQRTEAQDAIDALMGPVELAVRAALRRSFLSAYRLLGLTAAAEPPPRALPSSFSVDDLTAIRVSWQASVAEELLPLVAELFATGSLSALLSYPEEAGRLALGLAQRGETIAEVVDRRGAEYLSDASNRLVGIGDTSWNEARSALTEGMAQGESVEALAERLTAVLDVQDARAVTIARTEVVSAANAGTMDGARMLGGTGPTHKMWLATLGPRTREWHAEADGQVVPMGDSFDVGGEALDFPGDPAGSAENVINCRCTVLLVDDPDAELNQDGRETGGNPDVPSPADLAASAVAPLEDSPMRITMPRFARTPAVSTTVRAVLLAAGVPEPVVHPEFGNVYPFTVLLTMEGRWTGDERLIMNGALRWDGMLPLPLTVPHDDDPRVTVGVVTEVERQPGAAENESMVVGRGFLDADHPMVIGTEDTPGLARQVAEGFVRGVSIDLDAPVFGTIDPDDPALPADVDGEMAEWVFTVVAEARLRALAVTSLPAFAEAFFTLGDTMPAAAELPPTVDGPAPVAPEDTPTEDDEDEDAAPVEEPVLEVIAASSAYRVVAAAPVLDDCPPDEWFADPGLTGPTALTVTDDGRVYGHLALWNTCHTGYDGTCVVPPHSATGYAGFLVGEEVTDTGRRVAVGALTVDTGHAPSALRSRPAAAHYDDTGSRVANVTAGEDAYGVWVAGSVTHTATPAQVATLRAAPLSGDWRRIGNGLELVAALAVNSPGFPVPRTALAASGVPLSLVAAGVVDLGCSGADVSRSVLNRIAASVGRDHRSRAAELHARVHGGRG